jgi:hypothetical protein
LDWPKACRAGRRARVVLQDEAASRRS